MASANRDFDYRYEKRTLLTTTIVACGKSQYSP
jgi:hypothetical protein